MNSRQKEIAEVKQGVDEVARQLEAARAQERQEAPVARRPVPAPAPRPTVVAPQQSAPETEEMEGVVMTQEEEDEVEEWSDMEGVEREGLFASRHVPEPGTSADAHADVAEEGQGQA